MSFKDKARYNEYMRNYRKNSNRIKKDSDRKRLRREIDYIKKQKQYRENPMSYKDYYTEDEYYNNE